MKDGFVATVDVVDVAEGLGANDDAEVAVTGFGVVVPVGAWAPQPTATVEAMKRVRGEMDAVRRGMAGPLASLLACSTRTEESC